MKRKYSMLIAASAAVAAVVLMTGSSEKAGAQANKFDGVWCASIPGGSPFRWTYTLTPTDSSGKRALLHGDFHVPLPSPVPNVDYLSPMFGEAQMTGPDTGIATTMWYGMWKGEQGPEIVYIGISVSEIGFKSPGKYEAQHHMAFYAPTPSGRITPDDVPFLVYPVVVTSSDERMQQIPLSSLSN